MADTFSITVICIKMSIYIFYYLKNACLFPVVNIVIGDPWHNTGCRTVEFLVDIVCCFNLSVHLVYVNYLFIPSEL